METWEFAKAIDLKPRIVGDDRTVDFFGERFGFQETIFAIRGPGLVRIAFNASVFRGFHPISQRSEDFLVFFFLSRVVGG